VAKIKALLLSESKNQELLLKARRKLKKEEQQLDCMFEDNKVEVVSFRNLLEQLFL
jgi:hypothetical protein